MKPGFLTLALLLLFFTILAEGYSQSQSIDFKQQLGMPLFGLLGEDTPNGAITRVVNQTVNE